MPSHQVSRRTFVASTAASAACFVLPQPSWGQTWRFLAATQPQGREIQIPEDFVGFSYETAELADPSFFNADNRGLAELFCLLSPSGVLRIGGNSSEFCWWKSSPGQSPPTRVPSTAPGAGDWMPHTFTAIEPAGVDRLAEFLEATGWTAIYGLNLGTGTPGRAAEEAAYVADRLGRRLRYFQIGNEPEFYSNANTALRGSDWNFDAYLAQWLAIARAVMEKVPGAKFGGPDIGSDDAWVIRFAEEAPRQLPGRIVACTGHYYAVGPPDDPTVAVARLLAGDPKIDRELPKLISAAESAGLPYRMTEGNSCYRGGKPGMSNAFASALWAADYMLKLASLGAAGVNLHGGSASQIRRSLGGHLPGERLSPEAAASAKEGSFYTPIAGSRETGFKARPVSYGMKLAGLLAGGKLIALPGALSGPNATVYAACMPSNEIRVVVINKSADSAADLRLNAAAARVWDLTAPSLTSTDSVTLAGSTVVPSENWTPRQERTIAASNGVIHSVVAPASAQALFL